MGNSSSGAIQPFLFRGAKEERGVFPSHIVSDISPNVCQTPTIAAVFTLGVTNSAGGHLVQSMRTYAPSIFLTNTAGHSKALRSPPASSASMVQMSLSTLPEKHGNPHLILCRNRKERGS